VRILALVSDAFGGLGGIAQYNRDLLGALCSYPEVTEVVAVIRRCPLPLEPLPPKLFYVTPGARVEFPVAFQEMALFLVKSLEVGFERVHRDSPVAIMPRERGNG
jgi:hypothetical protein